MSRTVRTVIVASLAVVAAFAVTLTLNLTSATAATWTSYRPGYAEQKRGCGEILGKKHLRFRLTCTDSSGEQRAERRYDTYSSGTHRFRGTFTVQSLSGTRVAVKQTLNQDQGAYFILAVDKAGRLYNVGTKKELDTGIKVGQPVRMQTIHRVGQDLRIWINGKLVETMDSPEGNFYDKIGTYRTQSGHGKITVARKKLSFARK